MRKEAFTSYLEESELSQSSINEHLKTLERFERWAENAELTDIAHITHNEILQYVQYEKNRGLSVSTVNIRLNSIRKYYECLKQTEEIDKNPARRLFIKGAVKKIITNPLSYEELEALYNQYIELKTKQHELLPCPTSLYSKFILQSHKKNIVVLGMLIWQGLHSGELGKIEKLHVKINEGIIYIPSTKRSNSRELKLHPKQIITLHEYICGLPSSDFRLFTNNMHNTVDYLIRELKGLNPSIQNAQHIRASVILHWLKMYDKRKVQYMAGHKYISSTEHYEIQKLETLTDQLTRHHPFG